MYFDDEFFNEYEGDPTGSSSGMDLSREQGEIEKGLDPFDYHDPVNSYLFLSDDAQDELQNPKTGRLRCSLCGHEFMGCETDFCPI